MGKYLAFRWPKEGIPYVFGTSGWKGLVPLLPPALVGGGGEMFLRLGGTEVSPSPCFGGRS